MYRFLREPRWVALILFVPVAVFVFILLSRWQYDRYEKRVAINNDVAAHSAIAPVPVADVTPVGSVVGPDQQWRLVTATGTYDTAHEALVRQRPLSSVNGFWVVTPLITDGRVLLVNRGWLAAGSSATARIDPPAAPVGVVTVTGRVQPSEAGLGSEPSDIPAGQVSRLDVRTLAATANPAAPFYPGHLNLTVSEPAQAAGLTPIPLPEQDTGPHLSYAMQWIAFAIMFVVGLGVLIRREIAYHREQRDERDGVPRRQKRVKREDRELWDDDVYPEFVQSGERPVTARDSEAPSAKA